jgi:hypothetical protein
VSVTVRVSRSVVLVAGATAVLVAGAGAWVAWGGTDYRVDGPPPVTLTVDGAPLSLTGQEPVLAVTVAPDHPSRLVVDVGSPTGCSLATARVMRQGPKVVRVAAYTYADAVADGTSACSGPLTVDLGTPLGDRRVVEDGTDRVLVTGTVG